MVGLGRLELPTSRLSGVRSSHLSYRPQLSLEAGLTQATCLLVRTIESKIEFEDKG